MDMTGTGTTRCGRSIWAALWRRQEGAALAEFAFAAPVLITSILAIIEIGMIMFMNSLLEGAVREASRFGITGYAPAGISRADEIRQIVVDGALGLVQPSDIDVTTLVYGNYSSIGQPEPYVDTNGNGTYDAGESFDDVNGNGKWDADMGAAGVGGSGDIVVYTATMRWPMLTHYLDGVIGSEITLSASTTVRNEPYGTNPAP